MDFQLMRWFGGWVVGSAALYSHFVAPSCKLELARYSALLRIQDGARVWQKSIFLTQLSYLTRWYKKLTRLGISKDFFHFTLGEVYK